MPYPLDALDRDIIRLFREEPRVGVLEISRRLEVARGTVQSRLDKLQAAGVIRGFGPQIDLAELGYDVVGFTTIEVAQGRTDDIIAHLEGIPWVIEVHSIAGQGDLLVRLAASSNEHLMEVLQEILHSDAVDRAATAVGLANHVVHRTGPLLDAIVDD